MNDASALSIPLRPISAGRLTIDFRPESNASFKASVGSQRGADHVSAALGDNQVSIWESGAQR
jgi:hypothetical protein